MAKEPTKGGYRKIRQDQIDFLEGKKQEAEVNEELVKQYNKLRDLGQELLPHQEKRLKQLEREETLRTGAVSLEKKLDKQAKSLNKKKQKSANLGKLMVANLKKSVVQETL